MKDFNVYLYFPASDFEIKVKANSLKEAIEIAALRNPHTLLAKDVTWNDSSGQPVRVTGALENFAL